MKIPERNKAIQLRRRGKTYGEIIKEIPVSKGSLNHWLKAIALNRKQIRRIQYKNDKIKDKFVAFNKLKRLNSEKNKEAIFTAAQREINSISSRELKFIGIALYWAEGHKKNAHSVDFVNSDPAMIKLMMRWFREICVVRESQFRVRLQIHNSTNLGRARAYWSKITGIPVNQFTEAYTKTSPTSKRKSGKTAPNGICGIRVSDIKLITRIKGWINGFMALSSSPA